MDERFTYLVQKFLDNNLQGSEKKEFEKYLADPLCAAYLEDAKKVDKVIEEGFREIIDHVNKKGELLEKEKEIPEDIIEAFKLYGNSYDPEIKKRIEEAHQDMLRRRKRIRLLSYGAAAAAAVIIGLVLIFTPYNTSSPEELVKQYYKPYEYFVTRSAPADQVQFYNAINAYMSGNYSTGAGICREILDAEPQNPDFSFLYALNLMGLDSMQTAIQQFKVVNDLPGDKEGRLYISAHWYASLCYISVGKADSALIELEKLKGIDNLFILEEKVEELKAELKKSKW